MEDDWEFGLVLQLKVFLELMADTEGGGLVEDLALSVVLGVKDRVGTSNGDLVAVKDLHYDPFSVVVLIFLIGGDGDSEADGDGQLLFRLQGALHDFRAEDSLFAEDKFEEGVAISTVEEVYVLLS